MAWFCPDVKPKKRGNKKTGQLIPMEQLSDSQQ
jgi:hypothetical protein